MHVEPNLPHGADYNPGRWTSFARASTSSFGGSGSSRCVFDLAGKERELTRLETESAEPDFWSDTSSAQRVMRKLTTLRAEVDRWRGMARRAQEQAELLEMAAAENDAEVAAEVERETAEMEVELDRLELDLVLSGEYDHRSAILAIHAGAGGTDSQDWAERQGFKAEVLDVSSGEEAGIKSATIEVGGANGYGYLKAEHGVHRLVRLSPFDQAHRRHTAFALVEVMPEVEDEGEIDVPAEDIRMDFYRSSGAGGQNVQKTSTAVRLTHVPTGIVVTCQNERSQLQNKETAMKILLARLTALEAQKVEEEQALIKGEHKEAAWGNQIRSYVLHPYNMVKDHRTDVETSNTSAVLDGEISPFIEAYLRSQIGQRGDRPDAAA